MAWASFATRPTSTPANTPSQAASHLSSVVMRPGRNCWRVTNAEAKRSAVAQNMRSLPASTPGDSVGLSPSTPRSSNTSRASRRIAGTVQGATVTRSFASSVGAMRGWDAMGCPTEEGSQAISVVTRSFATVKLGSDSFSAARRASASATNGYTAAPGVARARARLRLAIAVDWSDFSPQRNNARASSAACRTIMRLIFSTHPANRSIVVFFINY